MIEGVIIKKLKILSDERGCVMHMLRSDEEIFSKFGEVYFSLVKSGVIKGWKRHKKMTQHFAVPVGDLKLVLYDDREDSPTKGIVQEILLGINDYKLVKIPPLVWYSFTALGKTNTLIANCADLVHNSEESETLLISTDAIPYRWDVKGI